MPKLWDFQYDKNGKVEFLNMFGWFSLNINKFVDKEVRIILNGDRYDKRILKRHFVFLNNKNQIKSSPKNY